jgi:hypothetical protein
MSDECQQHLHSRLKYMLMNNCNYTEYLPLVPHYLIDNYVNIYHVRFDIWSRLLVVCEKGQRLINETLHRKLNIEQH